MEKTWCLNKHTIIKKNIHLESFQNTFRVHCPCLCFYHVLYTYSGVVCLVKRVFFKAANKIGNQREMKNTHTHNTTFRQNKTRKYKNLEPSYIDLDALRCLSCFVSPMYRHTNTHTRRLLDLHVPKNYKCTCCTLDIFIVCR